MAFISCKKCESRFKFSYLIKSEFGTPFSGTMGLVNKCPVCKTELFAVRPKDVLKPL